MFCAASWQSIEAAKARCGLSIPSKMETRIFSCSNGMTFPGKEDQGEYPGRTIRIKKDQFQVSQNLKSGFELLLKPPLDFDKIQFVDVDTTEEEIRSNTDNLFTPRPNDDDPAG